MARTRHTLKKTNVMARLWSVAQTDRAFSEDFKYLVRTSVRTVINTPLPWVLVGHTARPGNARGRYIDYVWARFSEKALDDLHLGNDFNFNLDFVLRDETRILIPDSLISFFPPFCHMKSATSNQFRALVLSYAMVYETFEDNALPAVFLQNYKEACAEIALARKSAAILTPRTPASPRGLFQQAFAQINNMDAKRVSSSDPTSAVPTRRRESTNSTPTVDLTSKFPTTPSPRYRPLTDSRANKRRRDDDDV